MSSQRTRSIGDYEIRRTLHSAEREVYLGVRVVKGVEKKFVLNVVPSGDVTSEQLKEAVRRSAAIGHAGATSVLEVIDHDGSHVIVHAYQDGITIHRLTGYIDSQRTPLSDSALLRIGVDLLETLVAAEAASVQEKTPIVHGCLGPHQVLVTWLGHVHVMGYGMRMLHDNQTRPQWLVPYIAPEVLKGEQPTTLSDVYSVAAMLWRTLGRRPFPAGLSRLPPLRRLRIDMPAPVALAIDRALNPEPNRRTDAASLLVTLKRTVTEWDRDELAFSLDVMRARCTIEEEFLPNVSMPPVSIGTISPSDESDRVTVPVAKSKPPSPLS